MRDEQVVRDRPARGARTSSRPARRLGSSRRRRRASSRGCACDQTQELAGDVAGAAEHDRRADGVVSRSCRGLRAPVAEADAALQQIAELGGVRHRVDGARRSSARLMMSMPTWLSVAGPEITRRLDAELLAQQLRAAPRADRVVRAQHHRREHAGRCPCRAGSPRRRRRRAGRRRARTRSHRASAPPSSLSRLRVSAGAFVEVVATMPKSENIAMWRAPASSMARMSRRSATPVDLNASTTSPLCRKRLTIAQAAAVLPEFMQVPAIATTGTPSSVERHVRGSAARLRRAPARRRAGRDTGSRARRRALGNRTARRATG